MKTLILLLLLFVAQAHAFAQKPPRTPKFSVYLSAGPNLYLNNFDRFKRFVEPIHFNLGARIMWEPASRLSLGLKTGYYHIYTVNFNGKNNGKFTLTAIPIQTFFTMKIYKGSYILFGMGPSVYHNRISTIKGDVLNASFLSLADVSGGFGYIERNRKKVSFGAEFEYFFSAKSEENLLSLSLLVRLPL